MSDSKNTKAPPALVRDFHDGISVRVELPELVDYDGDEPTPEMIERAADALSSAIDQRSRIYLDGEDGPETQVWIELWDTDNADEWRIE